MEKRHCHFSLVCSLLIGGLWFSGPLFVATAAATDDEGGTAVMCRTGWNSNYEAAIPESRINDGYCDCPFNGKDEPDTDACSGSLSWAGISKTNSDPTTEPKFVCLQQPNLILPLSRLNDGICDCCDGSDEDSDRNLCIDNCDEVLKSERERLAKIKNDFLAGSMKREKELSRFEQLRTARISQADDLHLKIAEIKAEILDIEKTQIVGLKEAYVSSRMTTMKDLVTGHSMATELLAGLTLEELEALLVHVCQVAGEISKSDKRDHGEKTCLALRVAALDLGLTWGDEENYNGGNAAISFHNATDAAIVEIIFENAADESEDLPPLRWRKSQPKQNGRRRLDEVDPDLSMDVDDDMMYDDDYRDYMTDDRWEEDPDLIHEEAEFGKQSESIEQNDFINNVSSSLFSTTRAIFLKESQEILNGIDKILAKDDASNKKEEPTENGNSQSSDPLSYTSLRNDLRDKRTVIERGFQWGASAKFLLSTSHFDSKREILERLLIGTLFYGQIGALHVWQILQAILPEYKVLSQQFIEAEKICASPWAGNCPPKHVYRDSSASIDKIEYPPSFLLKVASIFCDEESSRMAKRGDIGCHQTGNEDNIEAIIQSLISLPSREGHSYFGYEVPKRRSEETDPFQALFDPISKLPVDTEGLRSLEKRRDSQETEVGKLENNLKTLWKQIGGKSGTDLGKDGEFHSIADQCFEIVAGKYTYELCMFGKAWQKDGGSRTNLGSFGGIEYLGEGEKTRILQWIGGTKCWNGPKRSATVHMTCGLDHKLVSANEPDTCRYVFEMESYLACDEAYKLHMGL